MSAIGYVIGAADTIPAIGYLIAIAIVLAFCLVVAVIDDKL